MIESPRRHGHFDPRYPQRGHFDLGAVANDSRLAIAIWEGEGGHASTADELSEPLDWTAFSALRSPARRRHDLEALVAYAHYRTEVRAGDPQSNAVEHDRGRAAYLVSL
jgi:hypothetical protein